MYPRTPNIPVTDPDLAAYDPQRLAVDQLSPAHQAELARLGFAADGRRLSSETLDIVGADALQALQLARVLARTEIPLSQDWCADEPGGCNGNLGLYRNEMPQIADKTAAKLAASSKAAERDAAHAILLTGGPRDKTVLDAFLDHLRKMGVSIAPAKVAVGGLRATQREIQTKKAFEMADAHLRGAFPSLSADTVVVSSDWHLLDGHHRWAALMTIDPARLMQVIQIDLPIRDILRLAAAFPGVYAADLEGRVQPDPFQLEYKRKAKAELAAHKRTANPSDNLSLLSAVLSFGYGDTHAASGIPSRRVYTLTERSAAAWSELLRLATVGGDVYSATERPGAIDAAVAFVEAVPTERLGRMQRAQASKLLKHLATAKVSAMTRRSNPSESVRIMRSANPDAASLLPLVRRYFPSATVSRTDTDGSRRTAYVGRIGPARGEPGTEHARIVWIEPGVASVRIRVYRYADPRIDRTLSAPVLVEERVFDPLALDAMLQRIIAKYGNGARTGNPSDGISISKLIQAYPAETAAIGFNAANPYAPAHTRALRRFADLLLRKLEAAYRKDVALSIQDGRDWVGYAGFNPIGGDLDEIVRETLQELAGGARTGNPSDDFDTLERNFDAAAAKSFSARQAYQKAYGQEALQRGAWMHSNTAKAKALRNALAEEREAFRAWAGEEGEQQTYGNAPALARTGNPPALIWEFDGEPTSPKELLADNPDNGDVAAAVAYLKKEGAKFAMGRHSTKSGRSWAAVSFGGGAADESVLTVRAAWTEGPVFKAVLDASTIPYAGDLPDAD